MWLKKEDCKFPKKKKSQRTLLINNLNLLEVTPQLKNFRITKNERE